MAVKSKQGLIDYCLRQLGYPLKKINVTDEQVEDRVEDAIAYWREYHYDGIEKVYLKHQLTQENINTKEVLVDDSLIYGVTKIHLYGNGLTTNNLFSVYYQLRLEDMYNLLGADLITYEIAKQHLQVLQDVLIGHKQFRWNRHTSTIHLDQDLSKNIAVGDYIIVECYRVLDPKDTPTVWGDKWIKAYTTALIKKQWGYNLKSFQGMQLPGGITIDGQGMYDEAVSEINELENDLSDKSAPLEWFVG